MNKPAPGEVIEAIKKWAVRADVPVVVHRGAHTRGRPWSGGIRGCVEHHWAGVGDGGLEWMAALDGAYPYCNAAIRRDGTIVILSALSAWGSGVGGPFDAAGVPKDQGHLFMWQNEFESWGREKDFTDEMWKAQAAIDCAIREVAGEEAFPSFKRLINHKGWTDGGSELGLDYYLPSYGRKNDTLYNIDEFRVNAQELWDLYVAPPKPVVRVQDVQPGSRNASVKLVKQALVAEGLLTKTPVTTGHFGQRMQKAFRSWQKVLGYGELEATGVPDRRSLRKLGKKHGWKTED